jgi:hypothetical protein
METDNLLSIAFSESLNTKYKGTYKPLIIWMDLFAILNFKSNESFELDEIITWDEFVNRFIPSVYWAFVGDVTVEH